jgi:hypothetical protein
MCSHFVGLCVPLCAELVRWVLACQWGGAAPARSAVNRHRRARAHACSRRESGGGRRSLARPAALARGRTPGGAASSACDGVSQRNRGVGVELETALPERTRHTARSPCRRRTRPRHPLGLGPTRERDAVAGREAPALPERAATMATSPHFVTRLPRCHCHCHCHCHRALITAY